LYQLSKLFSEELSQKHWDNIDKFYIDKYDFSDHVHFKEMPIAY